MSVARHFLDWSRPVLPQAAAYLIDRYARAGELDLSSVVLVFPGRRAARRMMELLLQLAGDDYPALVPPRMVTFHQLPEMLYPQQRTLADDITQLLVWRHAMESLDPADIADALPHLPDSDALTAWMSLCRTLRDQHDELVADAVEYDTIVQLLTELNLPSEQRRWDQLRKIHAVYLQQMDTLALWDRQEARLVAIENRELVTDADIILIGTVDMNRVVRDMLTQVADRVTAIIHAPADRAALFDEFGCVIPERWQDELVAIALEQCRIVDSPADQAREAVRQLRRRQDARSADEFSIGVADESLVPLLRQELADAGASGRWPVGMTLRESRPWRLLRAIADHLASARDGAPPRFSTLCDLVRHPDVFTQISDRLTTGSAGGSDWLTDLDNWLSDTLQVWPGEPVGREPERETVHRILTCVHRLLGHLQTASDNGPRAGARRGAGNAANGGAEFDRRLLEQRPLLAWAEGAGRVLAAIYADRELSDTLADQAIAACVQAWQRITAQLENIPASMMPQCSAAQALTFLLNQIADDGLPSADDDQAVELLGWLELEQDDAPVLVLTGFNEGQIPESVTSDVFLPNSLRERVGLTDNRRRYARDAYALTSMLHSREEMVLISGRVDEQNNPLTPSRLFFAVAPEDVPQRVTLFYRQHLMSEQSEPGAVAAAPGTQPPDVSGFVVPRPPAHLPRPQEIPVTWFRDYLACPYRYTLHRELRLSAVEDDVLELSAPAFGSLLHAVLDAFGRSEIRHATSAKDIRDFLRTELLSLAAHRFGSQRSATVNIQLSMAEERLDAFSEWQAGTAAEGWRIQQVERQLKYAEFRDLRDRPVVLTGRVDRIDRQQDSDDWRVLDYKTSEKAESPEKAHRRRDGEWVDLQLPLYLLLTRSLNLHGRVQPGYVHLPGDTSAVDCALADWDDAALESAFAEARRIATDILDLTIDRIAPGDGTSDLSRICQDTVVNASIPWLRSWTGREVHDE